MIKLVEVNKYFNKRKANEIHVINSTSIEFPESGIVAFLGPSGCGKTTLLNAIGGLDKINSGKIFVDGERITGKGTSKIDNIRNEKIGYIFQNYNLLDKQTVFDNVAIALKMRGIKDPEVIKDRVNYCLKTVGIYQYRHKRASALSGGQRQRVAIARAIVKNPSIIIADEPTGNLDSSNTLEIMNVIKSISKERLVILVTHEKEIAKFYSSRIIELSDGSIVNDYKNDPGEALDYQLDNKLFLKDIPINEEFSRKEMKIDYYSDVERSGKIKIILRGSNLYINTDGQFNIVDETSNIELIDDHYSKIDQSIYEKNQFEFDKYLPENYKAEYASIYTPWNSMKNGFASIKQFNILKKLLLLGFVLSSMFIFLSLSNIAGIIDIHEIDYMTTDSHYVTISNTSSSEETLNTVSSMSNTKYAIPGTSLVSLTMPVADYYQTASVTIPLTGSLTFASTLSDKDIVAGKMPEASNEIVVDKMIIDKFLNSKAGVNYGLTKQSQFLDRELIIPNLEDYKIVGISNTNGPSIFVQDDQYMNILANVPAGDSDVESSEAAAASSNTILDYALAPSSLKIEKGSAPDEDYEVLVNYNHLYDMPLNKTITTKMNGQLLKVVGYYTSENISDIYYVPASTVKLNYISKNKKISAYSDNPEALVKELHEQGISGQINYDRDKSKYKESLKVSSKASMIAAAIFMIISLLEIYLMLRSSFLSRIKEVGTMRAIGLKKKDIYWMFLSEIIAITLITAIPGTALMYYIVLNIKKINVFLDGLYLVTPTIAIASFVFVLLFNIIIGLIPVMRTMRKTPAEILSRTDI